VKIKGNYLIILYLMFRKNNVALNIYLKAKLPKLIVSKLHDIYKKAKFISN